MPVFCFLQQRANLPWLNFIFSILFFFLISNQAFSQDPESETVKVTVTNGELIRCITDNTVRIELIPNTNKTLVSMELYWDEDQDTPIIVLPGESFVLTNTYDLSELEEECDYDCQISNGFCRRIQVVAKYEGGSQTTENNSLVLTFKIPPRPAFEPNPSVPCINSPLSLDNNTCPSNDEDITYSWDFGNGQTSEEAEPETMFDAADNYTIRLTANTKVCGSATTTRNVRVISPALADGFPDQNITAQEQDTFIICGQGSYSTRLIGSESIGATVFEWTSKQSGVNVLDRNNDTTQILFGQPGLYSIDLEVDNGCDQPDVQELFFRVVEAQALQLDSIPDACTTISYTPQPFNEEATYTINGEIINSFPVDLPPSETPYLVEAELSNACGDQYSSAAFLVMLPEAVDIIQPQVDTSICVSNAPLSLAASIPGGNWLVDGQNTGTTFDPGNFGVGSYTLSYTVGEPGCETTDQLNIEVLPGPDLDVGADESVCINESMTNLEANLPGGIWLGSGITDSITGTFDPALAGLGPHEITYEYRSPSDGCIATQVKNVTVIDLPTVELPDSFSVCNAAQPINLTSIIEVNVTPGSGLFDWEGNGIINAEEGILDTKAAGGEGVITIKTTYRIPPGCSSTDSTIIRIDPLVVAESIADTTVCSSQDPVQLYGLPSGGIWLNENEQPITNPIDPSQLGTGNYMLTYILNRGTSCETRSQTSLNIVDGSGVDAGEDLYVCETAIEIQLPEQEGSWSGPSLVMGQMVTVSGLDTGAYTYTFTNSSLPPACNSDQLTLFVEPLPVLNFMLDTFNCVGESVAMDNTTVGDRFTWTFGDGNGSSLPNPSHVYQEVGNYTVSLEVETLHPITGQQVCSNQTSMDIQVFEPPTFVGFAPDSEEGCSPLTVSFNNESEGDRLQYQWDFGNNQSSTIVNPQDITFTTAFRDTTFQVSLMVTNGCGNQETEVPIQVFASPSAKFATEITEQYCSGEQVMIGHRSIGDSLTWDFGNGEIYSGFEPPTQQYFTSLDNDTIHLSLIASNQCGRDTAYQDLIIVPTDARAAISVMDNRPCVGDTVFLRSLSRPLDATVEWLFPDGSSSNGVETFYVFQESGNQVITSKVYSCGLDSTDLSFEIQPTPEVQLFAPPQSCPNTSFPIQLATQEIRKSIFLDGVLIAEGDRVEIEIDTIGIYTLSGQVISPEGCIVRTEKSIEIIEGPQASFLMLDSTCANANLTLQSTSLLARSCLWTTSDGTNLNGCSVQHTFSESGPQTAKLTVSNSIGCKDSTEQIIFVRPTPVADFSFEIIEPCTPAIIRFTSTSERENALRWLLPDGRVERQESFERQFNRPGSQAVSLIASNDGICFDTVSKNISVFVSPVIDFEKIEGCTQGEGYELQIETSPQAHVTLDGPGYSGGGTRHIQLQQGDYFIIAQTENGCIADSLTTIPKVNELIVNIPEDTLRINLGNSVQLQAEINQADVLIDWTSPELLNNPTSSTPIASPKTTTDFILSVTDSKGCLLKDTIVVVVNIDRERGIYIPNAFTPDNSGKNDIFRVRVNNEGVDLLKVFRVFDQNGNIVFENKDCDPRDINCAWDGQYKGEEARPGVYVYQINIEFKDGVVVSKTGDVTLIR